MAKKKKAEVKKSVKDKIKTAIKNAGDPKLKGTAQGLALIKLLGLEKVKYVWCQKILNSSISIFIITFDSRNPTRYLPIGKIKKNPVLKTHRLKTKVGVPDDLLKWKYNVPVQLRNLKMVANTGSLIIVNDLAGIYRRDPKIVESVEQYKIVVL
jgi:hypothetical protein